MRRLPPLRTLEAFHSVLRHGSFSRAADDLGLTLSAVSHRIRQLEERIGAPVFERKRSGVTSTVAGMALKAPIEQAFALLHEGVEAASRGAGRGIRFHVTPTLAAMFLMPRLSELLAAFPTVDLRIVASATQADPAREAPDVEIRYGVPDGEALMEEPIVPLASPALLARLGRPCSLEDLRTLPLIRSEINVLSWDDYLAAAGVDWTPSGKVLGFDRSMMSIRAAVEGLGVAFDSAVMAEEHLSDGRLVVPLSTGPRPLKAAAHRLFVRADHKSEAWVMADWLRQQARAAARQAWDRF